MLRSQQIHAQVHRVKTTSGQTTLVPDEIALEFRTFSFSLYNITRAERDSAEGNRELERNNFLATYVAFPLQAHDAAMLELPVPEKELLKAIKTLKTGRAWVRMD
ncbi:Hypothetical predicted protein [Pelobates cultripes]|uniref:Uncharacterized protein n=1 Tax=Pelobates cultripes TaxID=61616 RepID=A0AAD1R845_PELCU|nr:Hypothetical predicted protein [Pelobates cultripes]